MQTPSGVVPAQPHDDYAISSTPQTEGLQPPATPLQDVALTAQDVCALVGWSYRQLDFALRCGYVTCENDARGSGSRRRFTLPQLHRVILVAWLGRGGLTPQQAVALIDGDAGFLLAAFPGGAT